MALTSRRQRERDQQRRMARGRRNLTQLVGPQAQGQRTPMNRGSGSVSTVQAPKFQQSNVGDDITQAGYAYKGAKGIHDFTTGTEGGYNKAGVWVEGKEPWSLGGKSISDRLSQYGTDVGNRWGEATEGLFGTPTTTAPTMGANPEYMGIGPNTVNRMTPESLGQTTTGLNEEFMGKGAWKPLGVENNPYLPTGGSNQLADPSAGAEMAVKAQSLGAGGSAPNLLNSGSNLSSGGMGWSFPGGGPSSLLSSGTHASQAANIYAPAGSFGTTGGSTIGAGGGSLGGTSAAGGEAVSGMQGADAAASGASGQPWLAYANIAKDLIVGGPGSEKITGSTAGDAAIRAAAAYFTFGLSEIPYAFI
jgi:hypothetical protein